jgi:hypothetical protein
MNDPQSTFSNLITSLTDFSANTIKLATKLTDPASFPVRSCVKIVHGSLKIVHGSAKIIQSRPRNIWSGERRHHGRSRRA